MDYKAGVWPGQEKRKRAVVDPQLRQYGDGNGTQVDGENLTEVQTFRRYVAEKKSVPESRAVLLAYYQQCANGVVSTASY